MKSGADLKAWRERMGWSQAQAASALMDIGRRRSQSYEVAGTTIPDSLRTLAMLLEVGRFGDAESEVPISTLLTGIIDRVDAMPKRGRPRARFCKCEECGHITRITDAT